MPALLLYLTVSLAIVLAWNRWIQPLSGAAAMVVVLLPLCFTGKALLTGAVYAPIDLPFMSDPLRSYATQYGVTSIRNGEIGDLYQQIIPWTEAVRASWAKREWPLLNPRMLCGDILAAAAQPAPYDPFGLIALLIPLAQALTFGASITFFLAAFSAFVLARSLGCRDAAAAFAAAAWMCSGNMAFFVGWPLARVWALLPLILFAVRRIAGEPSLRSSVLLTVTLVLEILAGHPESLLHVVAIGVLYALFLRPSIRAIALASLCGAIALASTAMFLLPFLEAAPQSVQHELRAGFARRHVDTNWTDVRTKSQEWLVAQGHAENGGIGFTILALALVARGLARNRETFFFLTLAALSLAAGNGVPPIAGLIHELPLFDMAVNHRLIMGADLALAILAAFAVEAMPFLIQCSLVILLLLERLIMAGWIYPTIPERAFYPTVPTIAAIPRSTEPFRIAALFQLFVPDAAALYGLEDARGYSAMNNARLSATSPLWCFEQPNSFNRIDDPGKPFLSFLNIRYLLTPLDTTPPAPQWRFITQDRGAKLYENTAALPRAFVPHRVRYRANGDAILGEMFQANDFGDEAWIEVPEYRPSEFLNGPGRVTTRVAKQGLVVHADMEHAGWIVISETAWEGWRAYVDKRRVRIRRANHAFLAVHVEAGRHRIRLVYLPRSFTRGRSISFATIGLLAVSALTRAAIRGKARARRPA